MARQQQDIPPQSRITTRFTVRTLFVLLTVTAVAAACCGGLINAASQDMEDIGLFIPLTAAAPLALMTLIFYLLKIGDWLTKARQRDE